jgi:beta-galactosidase beta subunit
MSVHYLVEGQEKMGYASAARVQSAGPYDVKTEGFFKSQGDAASSLKFSVLHIESVWFAQSGNHRVPHDFLFLLGAI